LITSKTQGKKLKRDIGLAQRFELGRRMKWSKTDISFGLEDHPKRKLSNRNLPFMVKLPIGWNKVANTQVDNGSSFNLIMRKMFIEMGLSLSDLAPVHVTFHSVISGQSSTSIERIDMKVAFRSGDKKHWVMLIFKVASFDIGYICILGSPFLLKFMVVIHTACATMKMPGPNDIITIKVVQLDALA
jgi:hypothetical protein